MEKVKTKIFEIPVIPQTLNINNQKSTSSKCINLNIIRKVIKYHLEKVIVEAMFNPIVFKILLFQAREVL